MIPFILFFLGFVFCAFLHAVFQGYEVGMLFYKKPEGNQEISGSPSRSQVASDFLDNPVPIQATCLLMTFLAASAASLLAVRLLAPWGFAPIVSTFIVAAVVSPVILIFGEVIPRALFRRKAESLLPLFTPGVNLARWLFLPATRFISRIVTLMGQETDAAHDPRRAVLSKEEMLLLFTEAEERGVIDEEERMMIHSVIDLSATSVKEVMVPRTKVVAVNIKATRRELLDLMDRTEHTRIPVYKDKLDNVVGVVHLFDLLDYTDENADRPIGSLIRPVAFSPESKKVGELLNEMRARRSQLAIVLDEYGGTAGLVTLEDLLEELFGEIQDEFDIEPPLVQHLAPGVFLLDARMDLEEANREFHLGLEKEAETVGGAVTAHLGRIPQKGEQIRIGRFELSIMEGDEQKIDKIRFRRLRKPFTYDRGANK